MSPLLEPKSRSVPELDTQLGRTDTGPSFPGGVGGLPSAHSRPAATGRWRPADDEAIREASMFSRRLLAGSMAAGAAMLLAACGGGTSGTGNSSPILKASKIAIMHDNTTYAKGLADSAKQAAQAAGMTVTYFDAITPGQKDYTAALVKVGTGNPDALFYTGYYPEFGLLAKEYVSLSPSYKLDGDSADVDPSVIKVAGAALTNPGITITTLPTTEFIHNAKNDKFTSEYQSKYGGAPGDYSSYEYDGMMTLAQALKNDGGKTDAKSLNAAIHGVKISDGITGSIAFDSKGDRPAPEFLAVHAVGSPPAFQPIAIRQNGTWVASS